MSFFFLFQISGCNNFEQETENFLQEISISSSSTLWHICINYCFIQVCKNLSAANDLHFESILKKKKTIFIMGRPCG